MIMAWHRSHEASRRLAAIPGVGPILATLLSPVSLTPRPSLRPNFGLDRLVPKQH